MTETSKKEHVFLERVPCIHYLLCFWKDIASVRAFIDSDSKVNAMILAYASKLGFKIQHTDVEAQKIDSSSLEIFKMVLASFQIEAKLRRV